MDQPAPSEINVLTLNCWGLKYLAKYRNERLLEIGKRIAAVEPAPHIVGLQECWTQQDYQAIRKQTRTILPYAKFYHSGIFGGGLAILSKWPIEESNMYRYPLNGRPTAFFRGDWFVGKGVASARIRYGPGIKDIVEVFTTHLHAPYETEPNDSYICHRTAQAWEISKLMRGAAERGHLVLGLGDFNMIPLSLAHRLISTHAPVRDVWLHLHPDSSIGAAIDLVEKTRRRPIPTADFNVLENGATCDSVFNTWRWNKAQQKLLGPNKPQITIPGDKIDAKAKRLDYIFASTGFNPSTPELGGWLIKSANVGMLDRHPELGCSLSDHFSVECTLIHSSALEPPSIKVDGADGDNHSDHKTADEAAAFQNSGSFLKSPASSSYPLHPTTPIRPSSSPASLFRPSTAASSAAHLPVQTYDEIITMIHSYRARERRQRRLRLSHFGMSVLVSIGCWVGVWWSPSRWVAFLLMLVSSLGLMAGTVDGLIGGLFVGSEIRALKEFEWEIANVRAAAGGEVHVLAEEGIKDW